MKSKPIIKELWSFEKGKPFFAQQEAVDNYFTLASKKKPPATQY